MFRTEKLHVENVRVSSQSEADSAFHNERHNEWKEHRMWLCLCVWGEWLPEYNGKERTTVDWCNWHTVSNYNMNTILRRDQITYVVVYWTRRTHCWVWLLRLLFSVFSVSANVFVVQSLDSALPQDGFYGAMLCIPRSCGLCCEKMSFVRLSVSHAPILCSFIPCSGIIL